MPQPSTTPRAPGDVGVWAALLMTAVGGFIDAYLFLRHGVFAFAQTGNVVFLAVAIVQGKDWSGYAWPLLAYLAGLAAAQAFRAARPNLPENWIAGVLAGQVAVFAVLALLPAATPALVYVVTLSFVGGVRLDLFRSAGGLAFVPIATTGNLMRFVQSVGAAARDRAAAQWRAVAVTGLVVVAFLTGALLGAGASVSFGSPALWGAVLLEAAAFALYLVLIARDRGTPHGAAA